MAPPFFFRIDEIQESEDAPVTIDHRADWVPSAESGANIRVNGGVTGQWWFCNGQQIIGNVTHDQIPQDAVSHQVYSMFYFGGFGFWVLQGDATSPTPGTAWHPLRFEHDPNDGYSSYVCNAAEHRRLLSRRLDQQWLAMLLPSIYYDSTVITPYPQYGSLKGDLAIFLALIAFAIEPTSLQTTLPSMFKDGAWKTYTMPHGRQDRRGVVVYVYTCPPHSTKEDLILYERGQYYGGKYYH